MKTVLFLPNYLGGGFGHIARCVALAQAFQRRGDRAVFIMNGPHLASVAEAGFDTHVISTPRVASPSAQAPAYIYVPEMAYQIVRDGFDNRQKVEYTLKELTQVVDKVHPDLIIGDGYALTLLIARKASVPVVQFVKSAVHPAGERMVWWEEKPGDMVVPDVRPVFSPVLEKMGLPPITNRAEELLDGDLLLLPSVPPLDPMASMPLKTHYVGPVVRAAAADRPLPDWFSSLKSDKPVVYVTVGGAASHGGTHTFFDAVLRAFKETDWQVVVSTGGEIDGKDLGTVPSHIKIFRWVPGTEMIARSNVVVFHGGYTRMEILMQGLPSVVIPFHSEQEYYGRVMEKAGVSVMVPYSDEPYKCFPARWKGGSRWLKTGRFTVHVRPGMTMRPEDLRMSVERCLEDEGMKKTAEALKNQLESYKGCDAAVKFISDKMF